MTEGKSLTTGEKSALNKCSLIDDNATYIMNDRVHYGMSWSEHGGAQDKSKLNYSDQGCPRNNSGHIALVESRIFVGDCIRRSLQSAFPLAVTTYSSVSELRQHRTDHRLVVLSLLEAEKEARFHTLKALLEFLPGTPVIIFSDKNDPELARTAICCGAKGYIPFTMEFAIAVEAVRFVLAGGTYAPVDYMEWPRVPAVPLSDAAGVVTSRELAVVRAIQQGKSNKVIAYDMNMCESTVKVHVRNIMKKLKAKNRTDVAMRLSALI